MLGAIIGDVIGSSYSGRRSGTKEIDFDLFTTYSSFTDDTVLTIATAKSILYTEEYDLNYYRYARHYPNAGYGRRFFKWLESASMIPYNSYGNGAAMRVSPIGYAFNDKTTVLAEAKKSAECTHNHPEGIKGAQAVALAIFMSRKGFSKEEIRETIAKEFNYDLNRTIESIRPTYKGHVSSQESVPEAIIAFLDSTDFISAIRLAVSLGGDADTQAAIAGSIAEAFYKNIDREIISRTFLYLHQEFIDIIVDFYSQKLNKELVID